MQKFRYLNHTSDAKFRAFGPSLEEAFKNAALATASLMWECRRVACKIQHPVQAEGKDLKQLLVNFLEEILFLWDTRRFLLRSAEQVEIIKKDRAFSLRAIFTGDEISEKYKIFGDVKAITYNEMEIEDGDPAMVQVVVDV